MAAGNQTLVSRFAKLFHPLGLAGEGVVCEFVLDVEYDELLKANDPSPLAPWSDGKGGKGDGGGGGAHATAADADPRILPIAMVGPERRRDFRDLGRDVEEVAFESWPIAGPRTVHWVLMFLLRRGVAPTDHHRWWLSSCRLTASDWGTAEHYSSCWTLDLIGSSDQLDMPNITAAESGARRLQAI